LLHVYGSTETTTFATWHLFDRVPDDATTVPIGRPIANTTVYLLDDRMQPVPVGTPGPEKFRTALRCGASSLPVARSESLS
jgi:non-ribosomal peptide synthetase component F